MKNNCTEINLKKMFVYLSLNFVFFLFIPHISVQAAGNSLTPSTTIQKAPEIIVNPDGSMITIPGGNNTVTNPDGSESDIDHVYNASKRDGSYPNENLSGVVVSKAFSSVGIAFKEGALKLLSVPNFDFGSNTLDGKTRFIPLASNAVSSVGDENNGAYIDTKLDSSGQPVQAIRDSSKYRALIVSDDRLPLDEFGKYNGWKLFAHLSVGQPGSLVGKNSHSHENNVPGLIGYTDPNPDFGNDRLGYPRQFPVAIEFGNGYGNPAYTVDSLPGGLPSGNVPISHPATYYNSDPKIKGIDFSVPGSMQKSRWVRVDDNSNVNPDGIPSDNSVNGGLKGLFFPRFRISPQRNNTSQVVGFGGHLREILGRPSITDNDLITTIPMGNADNFIWGYNQSQQITANNEAVRGNPPISVSNGSWALDFFDRGSAIMALPKPVSFNRPGTYIYNLYWTLSAGFQSNPVS